MKLEHLSTSVSLIMDATDEDLFELEQRHRQNFTTATTNSSDARVPALENRNRWWPHTAKLEK